MEASLILKPLLISFVISIAAGPVIIPFLKKLKVGQTVRDDGPRTHLKKMGTPTMGGLLFLVSMAVTAIPYVKEHGKIVPVLFMTLGFALIGFLDDYIKVVLRRSMGLRAWQKMLLQLLRIPFWKGHYIDFGALNLPLLFVVVTGTVNGTNFTDGLDGLLGSVTVLTAVFFTVAAVGTKADIYPVTCAAAGALLGFLLFNVHPASVFMGDTGSLALGGFLAASAYLMQMPLYLPIVGFVYVAEVLSVMIQVVYFRCSKGKRFFRMAPLHHHFELGGYTENQIVAGFSVVTALFCLLALYGLRG